MLLSALPSCSGSDDGDGGIVPPIAEEYTLSLFLSAGDNAPAARITPQGDYNGGLGFENFIDIAAFDFRVYLFGGNNRLIYAVPTMGCILTPIESGGQGSKTYRLTIPMSRELVDRLRLDPQQCSFKLLMLANWRDYPSDLAEGLTTISSMMESAAARRTFEVQAGAVLTADERIPLFGVNYYQNVALVKNEQTILNTLHLLRSYSKIEVFDAPESTTAIHSVTLTRHNGTSYNAPILVNWLQGEYMKNNYKDDYGRTFRDPADEISDGVALRKDVASGHFFIYVAEFRNLTEGSTSQPRPENERTRLRVTYIDEESGENHNYYVDFKYYDEVNANRNGAKKGDFFNLRRNYWYRYSVNRGKVDAMMQVDVVPYVEVNLNPSFGFDDPILNPPTQGTPPPWVNLTPWD